MFDKLAGALKNNSSGIMFLGGIALSIFAIHETRKASVKALEVKKKFEEDLQQVEEVYADPELVKEGNLSEDDHKHDTQVLTRNYILNTVKTYAIPVALEAGSLLLFWGSRRKLKFENASLAAAATTSASILAKYRKNVVERFGEDVDKELRCGKKVETVTVKTPDKETGEIKKEKKKVEVVEPKAMDDYMKIFDSCTSSKWTKDPWQNKCIIKAALKAANAFLISRGYVFLNEVYEMLGMKPTIGGQTVGWYYDIEHPERFHNKIDFGIWETDNETVKRFLDGYEAVTVLDFNVDGVITPYLKGLLEKI